MTAERESLLSFRRRVHIAGALALLPAFIATFGWGNHWNAYTNLSLTLGDVVMWVTLYVALRPRTVTLTVTPYPTTKIRSIKEIRAATGLGLREAKEATEGTGLTLASAVGRDLAKRLDGFAEVTVKRG